MTTTLHLTGHLHATGAAQGKTVVGFRVGAALLRSIVIPGTGVGKGEDTTLDLVGSGSALVAADNSFDIAVGGDGDPAAPATVTVSTPEGVLVHSESVAIADLARPLDIEVDGLQPLTITPSSDPGQGTRLLLTGQVIDAKGASVPSMLPVVI